MDLKIIDRYISGDPLPSGSVLEDQRGNRWHLVLPGVNDKCVSILEPVGLEIQPTHTCQNWGFTMSSLKTIRTE